MRGLEEDEGGWIEGLCQDGEKRLESSVFMKRLYFREEESENEKELLKTELTPFLILTVTSKS